MAEGKTRKLESLSVSRKEGSVSNALDDIQKLTLDFNNTGLLVTLARVVLLEWWDKFILEFKNNRRDIGDSKYKHLLILRSLLSSEGEQWAGGGSRSRHVF